MLVTNDDGQVLAAERSDIPGAWQAPQGGLMPDEEPLEAARRELAEETGIDWADIITIDEYPEWLAYELPPGQRSPKAGRGQVQRWFLLHYRGPSDGINVTRGDAQEFVRWRWVSMARLIDQAWVVKRPIYRRLAAAWSARLRAE
jgi:putative (di)nucleoside polyphosphate hydrolase